MLSSFFLYVKQSGPHFFDEKCKVNSNKVDIIIVVVNVIKELLNY